MYDDLSISFVDADDVKVRLQMSKANALDNPPLKEATEMTDWSLQDLLDRAALHDRKVKWNQA